MVRLESNPIRGRRILPQPDRARGRHTDLRPSRTRVVAGATGQGDDTRVGATVHQTRPEASQCRDQAEPEQPVATPALLGR